MDIDFRPPRFFLKLQKRFTAMDFIYTAQFYQNLCSNITGARLIGNKLRPWQGFNKLIFFFFLVYGIHGISALMKTKFKNLKTLRPSINLL